MNDLSIRTNDLIDNPTTRLAVGLCLDVSGSMYARGEGEDAETTAIEELNKGVSLFYEEVKAHDVAKHAVEVAVVAFSGKAFTVRDFEPVLSAEAPHLDVDSRWGGTSLGSGVEMTLDLIDGRKQAYKAAGVEYFQPWVVLLTDGRPTDETHVNVAPRIARLVGEKKLSVFPIGVGAGADLAALAMLSSARKPLRLRGLNFAGLFEFLAKSVAAVSESRPGERPSLPTGDVKTWAQV